MEKINHSREGQIFQASKSAISILAVWKSVTIIAKRCPTGTVIGTGPAHFFSLSITETRGFIETIILC
jgi:hypothetical protein